MRNEKIDIAKGILIILVVLGHTGFSYNRFFAFQIPVFFMVSGYLYTPYYYKNFSGLKKLFFKRLGTLYIPYVISNVIFTILNNPLKMIHVYDENIPWLKNRDILKEIVKTLFFAGGGQLTGALWFLRVLFFTSAIFYLLCFIGEKIRHIEYIYIIISIAIVWGLEYLGINFMSVAYIFSALICLFMGKLIKDKGLEDIKFFKVLLSMVALVVLCSFPIEDNLLHHPVLMICIALPGWWLVLYLSTLIKKYLSNISRIVIWCGRHTLSILILHFSIFKVVSYIGILIYRDSIESLGAFPYLYEGIWSLIYVVSAIFGSFLLIKLKDTICRGVLAYRK